MGGLAPGESNDLQRGCRKSPPAEVDHDLEIPVEGEPEPASLFKLADDYARLFDLACEERLRLIDWYARRKLIINLSSRAAAT